MFRWNYRMKRKNSHHRDDTTTSQPVSVLSAADILERCRHREFSRAYVIRYAMKFAATQDRQCRTSFAYVVGGRSQTTHILCRAPQG